VVVQALALVIEQYMTKESGQPVEVTFSQVKRSAAGLEVADFKITHKTEKPHSVTAKHMLIYQLEPGAQSKSMIKASIRLEKISGSPSKNQQISVASLELKGLILDAATGSLQIEEGILQDFSEQEGDETTKIRSLAAKNLFKDKDDLVTVAWGQMKRLQFQEKTTPASGMELGFSTGVSMGEVEFRDLRVREETEEVSLGEFMAGNLRVTEGRDRYRMGELHMNGFQLLPNKGLAIKSAELNSLGALVSDKDGVQGMDLASVRMADFNLPNADDPTSLELRSVSLEQLTAYYNGKEVAILDGFNFSYHQNGPWLESGLDLRGLSIIGTSAPQELKEYLMMVGEDDLVFSLKVKARGDQAKKLLDVQQIRLEGRGLGTLEMAFRVTGLNMDRDNPNATMESMNKTASLAALSIIYKDKAFASSLITNMAKEQKTTVDKVQAQAIAQIKAMQAPSKSQAFRGFLAQAIKFMDRPGELTLVAQPPKPVLISSLEKLGPDGVFETLGIKTMFKPGKKLVVPPPKAPAPQKPMGAAPARPNKQAPAGKQ
jgi:hypothetical protein